MFSIIIPTFNNLNYVKILLSSLKKNSSQDHEIIFHVNEGSDGTLDYLNKNNLKYTFSKANVGLCTATNIAASKSFCLNFEYNVCSNFCSIIIKINFFIRICIFF